MSNIKFNTAYAPPKPKAESKCPTELQDYLYNPTTNKLEKIGKIQFYEEIQSHYESTKLSDKLRRAAMGDIYALGTPSGAYIDTTNISTNLAEVLNAKQSAQRQFEQLPIELRELFGNDFTTFIRCIEDGSYQQKLIEFGRKKSAGTGTDTGSGKDTGTGNDTGTDTSKSNN